MAFYGYRTDREPTHRDLCRAVALWTLEARWCNAVTWEIAHGGHVLDVVGISRPESVAQYERRVLGWSLVAQSRDRYNESHPGLRIAIPKQPQPVPVVVRVYEVKRTASDLHGDLRRRKMHGYEKHATQCVLAATVDALGIGGRIDKSASVEALRELTFRGLPGAWGVIALATTQQRSQHVTNVRVLRRPRELQGFNQDTLASWGANIARSMSYRVLYGKLDIANGETI